MQLKIFWTVFAFTLIFSFALAALADMGSANYRITTSVMSGGGAPMGSASYESDSTLGQPSPLMDPADPPGSTNYWLDPGFWYTLEGGIGECTELSCFAATYGLMSGDTGFNGACDFEPDGDVDGSDLAVFAGGLD